MSKPRQILILEDDSADAELVTHELRKAGLEFVAKKVTTEKEFLAELRNAAPELILADYSLPGYRGLSALAAAQKQCPGTPFIFVSGSMGEEKAIEALHHGATDYVLKQRLARLGPAVRRALREREERHQREQAEKAARETEEQFRAMFEVASIGMGQADPRTGQFVRVNQKLCAITGYSAAEMLRLRVSEITHPDDRQKDWEAFQRVVRGEAPAYRVEKRYLRKDGAVTWANVNMTVIRDAAGQPTRTMATIEDITERKHAELRIAAFANLGQRLNAAKTAKEAGEIIVEVADELLGWDACVFDLYSAAENRMSHLLSMDLIEGRRTECTPPHLHRPPTALHRRTIEQGGQLILRDHPAAPQPEDLPFGDTSRPSASLMFVPIRHGTEVIGILSIQSYTPKAYDASSLEALQALADYGGGALERLRAEEALSESEANFRSVWERTMDGMRLLDKEGRIVAVNEAFCQLVKLPREELEGQLFSVAYKKHGRSDSLEVYQKRFASGDIDLRTTPRVQLWNSDELDLEVTSSFIELGQRGKMLLGIFRDVSERKRAELRMAAFANLGQRLNTAKTAREAGEIIVGVADELLGWDACLFDLYSAAENRVSHLLSMDLINGRRTECEPRHRNPLPRGFSRRAIDEGGQLILRDPAEAVRPENVPFGAETRRSASLMFVPVRHGTAVVGVLSIQSYTPKAYDAYSLEALQALADYGGGALERLRAQEALGESEANFRSVWEHSIDGMRLTDKEGSILAVNEAFCQLVKLPREKLQGQIFSVAYQGHGPTDGVELYQKRFAAGDIPPHLTTRTQLCNGEEVDLDISSSFIELGQRGKMLLSIVRDVSERKHAELRIEALSKLGQKLSTAKTAREAAGIISEVADELLGWDAFLFSLRLPSKDLLNHVLNVDTIAGRRVESSPGNEPASVLARRAIEAGGQLILKEDPRQMFPGSQPFGDAARPSASMMYVPVRKGAEVVGVMSIQSYTPGAYDARSLETLQALADHCGGALDRIRTQEALMREQEFTRTLLDNITDGVVACDAQGALVLVNQTARKWHGLDAPAVPPGGWAGELSLCGPDGVTPLSSEAVPLTRAFHGETIQDVSLTIVAQGQPPRHILASGGPFFDASQKKLGAVVVVRDITERKRAELRIAAFSDLGQQLSAAKTAREAAEIIVEVADHLLGWDACSVALFLAAEKLMRHVLTRDTVDGRRIETSSAYDHSSPPSPLANRAIMEGGQLILKAEPDRMQPGGLPFGDTSRPSASLLFVPIRKGTEVIGVLSIQSYTPRAYDQQSLDTLQALADHCGGALDRLTKEEALKSERRTAQRYLDIAGVMIVAIDPSQNVLLANRKTCEVLACAESNLIGHNWFQFAIPAEGRDGLKAAFGDMVAGKIAPWEYVEGAVLTRRGEQRLIAWHNTLLQDETGRVIATLSSGEDITGRKELETQLRQSQKMEAVGQLAGGVAHDFNNMLAVIRGNAELLLMDEDQHTAETREGLKQVVAASERAANLTRQLLTFSRKQVMQSQPLVLNEVIVNLTKMLHRVLRENIALQCDYTAPLPCVQADTGMMEQVILNLVVNARDAMPQGGQLRVATERLTLDEAQARVNPEARAGEFVCLLVSDTGAGIAPEVLPRIFEPFFTTKELGKGTGLGLATVYGIVQQHQGWIEVSSQVGQGTTFKVFLPAIPTPARLAAAAEAGAEVRGGKETILLVEDEHAVRMATRRVLESKGYTVREATTAPEALEVWQRHAGEIALLLTDIIMPGEMTGRDLAERLWGQKPGLKVIFMSGYSADVLGKGTEFIRRTHSQFLQKPSTARVILGTVRRSLDENEPVAASGEAGHAK